MLDRPRIGSGPSKTNDWNLICSIGIIKITKRWVDLRVKRIPSASTLQLYASVRLKVVKKIS